MPHLKIRHFQWRSVPVEERARRLHEQTNCRDPEADTTSGLVAYLDGEPAGWCAVEPRTAYPRLRDTRVPWTGREEDKSDAGVWAVTCFVTRVGSGAEGHPMITQPGRRSSGASSTWAAEASSPTPGSPRSAGPRSGAL